TDGAVQLLHQNTILIACKIVRLACDSDAVRIFEHACEVCELLTDVQRAALHYCASARMR
ncbi:MAG: hypothetical protein ABJX46_07210, partial [Erythrobacter sp.]